MTKDPEKIKKVLVQTSVEQRYKDILKEKAVKSSGGLAQQARLAIIKYCEDDEE